MNIKKGTIVGCKVDLRARNKFNFIDTLYLTLPRIESTNDLKIKPLKNNHDNGIVLTMRNIFIFHAVELELNNFVKNLNISFITNTKRKIFKQFLSTALFIK